MATTKVTYSQLQSGTIPALTVAKLTGSSTFTIEHNGGADAIVVNDAASTDIFSGNGVYVATVGNGNIDLTGPSSLLRVSSAAVLASATNVTVTSTLLTLNANGNPIKIGGGTSASPLRFYEPSGSGINYTEFKARAQVADIAYLLPDVEGTDGQVLIWNTGGNLNWGTFAGSSSGIAGAVQFSAGAGAFSSDATNFFFNDGTNNLLLAGGTSTNLTITGVNGGISVAPASSITGAYSGMAISGDATGNMNLSLTNTNTTVGTSNARFSLTTGAGGGDPFLLLSTAEAGYVIGVDNDASDKLFIGLGSNPSTMTTTNITLATAHVGILQATPTAKMHVGAGTTVANTAPIKIDTGTALTTPEDGAMEYHASHLYFTIGATRYQLDQQSGGSGDIINGGNTTAATVIIGTNDANALSLETNNVVRLSITGGASTGGEVTLTSVTANTNTVANLIVHNLSSSGTAATGFGLRRLYQLESSTTLGRDAVAIDVLWADATDATRMGDIVFSNQYNGTGLVETFRIAGNGGAITASGQTVLTNAVQTRYLLNTNSTGTAATGFGSIMKFRLESSTTVDQDAGGITALWTNATHASRTSAFLISAVNSAGALGEVARFQGATTPTFSVASAMGTAGTTAYANASITSGADYTIGGSSNQLLLTSGSVNALGSIRITSSAASGIGIGVSGITQTSTTSARVHVSISEGYTVASGSGTHTQLFVGGTHNLTSTASGILMGLDVSPTLTSLASGTYRSVNISANNSAAFGIYQSGANTNNIFVGKTTFGAITTPTALLMVAAGTTTVPGIQLVSGTLNTTALAGALEYNGTFYHTKASALRVADGGVIADFFTDASNVTTGVTDLYSYTTPISTLANNGEKLTAKFGGIFSDMTATAVIGVLFGGVSIYNSVAITLTGATGSWSVETLIIRTGATTARAVTTLTAPGSSVPTDTQQSDITGLTFTNTNILKITAQAGGAGGGSNDITAKLGTISWQGAANN